MKKINLFLMLVSVAHFSFEGLAMGLDVERGGGLLRASAQVKSAKSKLKEGMHVAAFFTVGLLIGGGGGFAVYKLMQRGTSPLDIAEGAVDFSSPSLPFITPSMLTRGGRETTTHKPSRPVLSFGQGGALDDKGLLQRGYRVDYLKWTIEQKLNLELQYVTDLSSAILEEINLSLMVGGSAAGATCRLKADQASQKVWNDQAEKIAEENCRSEVDTPLWKGKTICKNREKKTEKERCGEDKTKTGCKELDDQAWQAWKNADDVCKRETEGARVAFESDLRAALQAGRGLKPLLNQQLTSDNFYRFLSGKECATGSFDKAAAQRCLYGRESTKGYRQESDDQHPLRPRRDSDVVQKTQRILDGFKNAERGKLIENHQRQRTYQGRQPK